MPLRPFSRLSTLALLLALNTSFTFAHGPRDDSPPPVESHLRVRRGVAAGLHYVVVEPRDVPPDAELPMIVFIHGRGDRPHVPVDSIWGLDRPVRLILPRAPDAYGDGYAWMPVSAHRGESEPLIAALSARERMLASALTEWRHRYPTRGKPIVAGFSQGGMLAMTLAVREHGAISRAIAMAGWIPPSLMPPPADPYAMYARIDELHGGADPILDPERTHRVVRELSERGFRVDFQSFPGVGHEVSDAMHRRFRQLLDDALDALPHTGSSGTA